jgi:hypothetical protein
MMKEIFLCPLQNRWKNKVGRNNDKNIIVVEKEARIDPIQINEF